MELNLNLTDSTGIVKKNIKGVKLIGMEGGTLRRPSLQARSTIFIRFYFDLYIAIEIVKNIAIINVVVL